jgi:hypothetical protein
VYGRIALPLPLILSAAIPVIQLTLLPDVHVQLAGAVMVTVPEPPVFVYDALVGETLVVQDELGG